MIVYLIKSTTCLALFFLFYKLFLEKENMHVFKRFYLLGSLVASFCIPLVAFTSYVFVAPMEEFALLDQNLMIDDAEEATLSINYVSLILWTIYAFGVLIFALKFIYNLWGITTKIRKNPHLKTKNFVNVLLKDLATPYTFLHYIFLDKYKFEAQKIPKEVILHEQTHAKQKHSLDVLFIELLQIACWFNPLLYVTKHAIKLNHEFLADQAVLKRGVNTSHYQNILLNFSSTKQHAQLTNAINYSFIKKRFTIMKTQTSKRNTWTRILLVVPLITMLLLGFSNRTLIQQDRATPKQIKVYNKLAKYYNSMPNENMTIKLKDVEKLKHIYDLMSKLQRTEAQPFPNFPPPPPPPTIDKHSVTKGSEKLQAVSKQFSELAEKYIKAVGNYHRTKENYRDLKLLYKKVISVHKVYSVLAESENISIPPPPPPFPGQESVYKGQNSDIPPPPQTPPNPLDHMIELAKKGATFYYEDDKISSDKAIAIVKTNKSINIQVRKHDSNNPIVKLSKKPITFKKN